MKPREIKKGVSWVGAIDWDRRLFDALIPLPDGTSYNAYLVEGKDKVALLDAVDPEMADVLLGKLENVPRIDYIVSHHAEQDHSGTIPKLLEKYPEAKVIASPKAKGILIDLLQLDEDCFMVVDDGQTLSLGDKTLEFIHTPWVHWPDTMVTYLKEDRILFSCDFFGSHIATTDLYVVDQARVYEAAKRYYAEIMLPFRKPIENNLKKLDGLKIEMIAPSHGPIYDQPGFILDAYKDWTLGKTKNLVALPYVSMHDSTKQMVDYLISALVERGVGVQPYDLTSVDVGKLAMTLIDATTIVIGTPTVLTGPHPAAAYAAILANLLRPKAQYFSIIGSFSWGSNVVDKLTGMMPNVKAEVLPPVLGKGLVSYEGIEQLDALADQIADKHKLL
jgi:flavorubredoxin